MIFLTYVKRDIFESVEKKKKLQYIISIKTRKEQIYFVDVKEPFISLIHNSIV